MALAARPAEGARPAPPRRRRPAVHAAAAGPLTSADVAIERRLATISLSSVVTAGGLGRGVEGGSGDADGDVLTNRLYKGKIIAPGPAAGDADGDVLTVRLYKGSITAGPAAGTRVILKAYGPGEGASLAANEVAAHRAVEGAPSTAPPLQIQRLVGSFPTAAGERWLVFADSGARSAATYARLAASAGPGAVVRGDRPPRPARPASVRAARRVFITKTLRDAAKGVAALHDRGRLHCALGPGSLLLAPCDEAAPSSLTARLADLSLSADVSDAALMGGGTLGELWDRGDGPPDGGTPVAADAAAAALSPPSLAAVHGALWHCAAAAGARAPRDRAAFGRADDVAAWGLLAAFLAIAPLASPAAPPVDAAALARLVEGAFKGDVAAFRDYAAADPDWGEGCAFLDGGGGAGWDCLAAALGPWRGRPDASELLTHPFLNGEALEAGR